MDISCSLRGSFHRVLDYHDSTQLFRSAPIHHYPEDFIEDELLTKHDHHYEDPILAELSDDEIVDALELLDKIKHNQHHNKQLSDREVNNDIGCLQKHSNKRNHFIACSPALVGYDN